MTLAARRRLFFWGYLLVVTALYTCCWMTVRGAIDRALIVWSQTGGIR